MRWTPGGVSGDIEDRRGGGGGFGFRGLGGLGLGGAVILLVLSLMTGRNFFAFLSGDGSDASGYSQRADRTGNSATGEPDRETQFVSFVLDDVQGTWDKLLPAQTGVPYRHAKLVLFRDYTTSGCGEAESATGPFYCPADQDVYVDLGFFDELASRFGAPGEFAQAYVLAHEIGHHVQRLLGIEAKVQRLQRMDPSQRNPLSVRLELQADCLAGVWANASARRDVVEQSDIPEGLRAAAAVGDDRLQKMARGHVSPETFTHGSSEQRTHWFRQGYQNGSVAGCETFGGTY